MNPFNVSLELSALQKQYAYRKRRTIEGPQGVNVTIDGGSFLSFCSNDYLGLANHPRVRAAACKAINQFGVGSGASQLISGYSTVHAQLEQALADFLGFERVLLFSSGYLANLGVIAALTSRETELLEDRLNHASLIDAARLAGARLHRYNHRNISHLKELLDRTNNKNSLIVSDGVFSMEGSIAPLAQLSQLKSDSQSRLMIDDAHGIGVLGKHGRGSIEHYGLNNKDVDILVGTFGKAFGSAGAFIAAESDLIEYLIQKARTLIYTTAPPPALAAAAVASLAIIRKDNERRERLHRNIAYFRNKLANSTLTLQESETPIQTIIIGDNRKTLEFCEQLALRNFLVFAIRPPTVPANTSRLRITLCSEHTPRQIDSLVAALQEIGHESL